MPNEAPVVLVADDQKEFCKIVSNVLGWHGLKAVQANSGAQAIDFARRHKPDLVLLDLRLDPGPDGEEVLHTLKSDPETKDIPIIAFTGFERTVEKEERLVQAGAHSLVDKFEAVDLSKAEPELVRRIKALILARRSSTG